MLRRHGEMQTLLALLTLKYSKRFLHFFCLIAVLSLSGISPVWGQENTPGIPSNMGTGITETVDTIMARENSFTGARPAPPLRIAPKGLIDRNRKHNPDSPNVSRWPYPDGAGSPDTTAFGDVLSPAASPLAPQTPGVSIVAATSADSP